VRCTARSRRRWRRCGRASVEHAAEIAEHYHRSKSPSGAERERPSMARPNELRLSPRTTTPRPGGWPAPRRQATADAHPR
jgi:hypothetical protein